MTGKTVVLALLVLSLRLSTELCWCACENQFLEEPGIVPGSPITCNILEARVEINCKIATSDSPFDILWYYTSDRIQAGKTGSDPGSDPPYFQRGSSTSSDVSSCLTIEPYRNTDNGFYWCQVGEILGNPLFHRFPSQIVNIETEFTVDQLKPCTETVTFSSVGQRCALGDTLSPSPVIVLGVEFTNISTTTTTTEDVTTTTTTEEETTSTTTEMASTTIANDTDTTEDGGGGGGGGQGTSTEASTDSNVVRTAVIWFSVGSVSFVLLTGGVILCVVALVKC